MNIDEFKKEITNLSEDGIFTFGKNWVDFVNKRLNKEIVNIHYSNLRQILFESNIQVEKKSIIDIGCGSGLSSLAFSKMMPLMLTSIDIDEDSIAASNIIKSIYSDIEDESWSIQKKSVFDLESSTENYDLVYSWGVLHHTGNVWEAIRKAASVVKKEGYIYLALYKSGEMFSSHTLTKTKFKSLQRDEKISFLYDYLYTYFISKGAPIFSIDSRGMNKFHDALDWLGGFPYEVVDPEVLRAYMSSLGFDQLRYINSNEGGCFTYIGKRRLV